MLFFAPRFIPLVIPANAGIHLDLARKAGSNRNSTMDSGFRRNDGPNAVDGVVGEVC